MNPQTSLDHISMDWFGGFVLFCFKGLFYLLKHVYAYVLYVHMIPSMRQWMPEEGIRFPWS